MTLEGIIEVRFTRQRFVHPYELTTDADGRLIEIVDLDRDDLIPSELIREARSYGWIDDDNAFWDKWFAATEQERLDPPLWQEAATYTQRFVDNHLTLTFDEGSEARLRIGAPLTLGLRRTNGTRTRVLETGSISQIIQIGL